jgi:cytochrome c peroxidase
MVNAHGAVYEGSIPDAFGDRKPPTAAYGGESPVLYYDEDEEVWVGGMFWDGRATGWVLGDPLAEQAQGPFLNLKEQALANAAAVVNVVTASSYADLFAQVLAELSDSGPIAPYDAIGLSIAAYERSAEVNPFSSKYDAYLKGQAKLNGNERRGLELFLGKGKCALCHTAESPDNKPVFTDFTYDNLGIPKNPENPVYLENPDFVDAGLGGFLLSAGYDEEVYMAEWGKFKVPTLRNVAKAPSKKFVKAFGHNGYFKSLKEIVHFYNTRDVKKGKKWPAPEYAATVNNDELGDLGLTDKEEDDIVAFMETLTDGWKEKD